MAMAKMADSAALNEVVTVGYGAAGAPKIPAAPDLTTVPTRTDFRETAFWEPALHTDKNGDVVLEFQMPEAVTRWQLLALAHDQNLHSGQLARRRDLPGSCQFFAVSCRGNIRQEVESQKRHKGPDNRQPTTDNELLRWRGKHPACAPEPHSYY